MNEKHAYQGLNFKQRSGHNIRLNPVQLVIPGGFIMAWLFFPPAIFFWLALLLVCALTWASSFGWPQALETLIEFLQRLQKN